MDVKQTDEKRQVVVYVDGIFDLFHPGHLAFLAKARALGDVLVAGVITDRDAKWKRPPVMAHAERVAMLRHCTLVDRVVEEPPLVLTDDFLDQHGINLVVHGDDSQQAEFFAAPIRRGIMRYVPYTRGVSTTDIMRRIQERAQTAH